jgi:LCP family protein required for cell wall assembly
VTDTDPTSPGIVPGADPEPTTTGDAARAADAAPDARPLRRRYAAAAASLLLPGLGQLVLGRRRAAALLAGPVLAVLVAGLLLGAAAGGDLASIAARLVDPAVLGWLLALQLALLAWWLVGLGTTLLAARPPRYRRREAFPVLLLVAAITLPGGAAAALTWTARDAALEVFAGAGAAWRPSPTPGPTLAPAATPSPTPSPTPEPLGYRTTILLIGEDSGPDRNTALTDTMVVASLDPIAGTVSMLSIPRDLVDAPIPGGGVYEGKINSLVAVARRFPDRFPGSNGVGEGVLAAVIGEMIGLPIDYWARVNLPGMFRLIDTVGGIDVTITRAWCDPQYREYGQRSFGVIPGRWHLDASQALAFARVRKPAGESDFSRAARQQEVLIGLRDAIVRGGFINDPLGFLRTIGSSVTTNVPPGAIPSVAAYATRIRRDAVYRAVLTYPLISDSTGDARGFVEIPDLPRIRELAATLFPPVGTLPSVPRLGTGVAYGFTPVSGPSPTPSPTPRPSAAGPGGESSGPTAPPTATPVTTPMPTLAPVVPTGRAPKLPTITCTLAPATPRPSASPSPSPSPSGSATTGDPAPSPSPTASLPTDPTPAPTSPPATPPPATAPPTPTPVPTPTPKPGRP